MPPASKDIGRSLIGERIGRYEIKRQLGRGGMGVVFEAVHQDIGHRAVVKVLSAELAKDPKHQDYVERFLGEARAVNIIQHPGIVQIFDFGQLRDGTVYIMMEFLDGEALWDRMERLRQEGGKIGPAEALRTVRQLASSLAAAHERGIVHRDLKPENVILVADPEAPGEERTKLLDFGIAKFLDSPHRMTTAGMVLGTALYMSPEQCQGTERLDDRSDVYSLGVMLYELLAGAPPFDGEPGKVLRAHVFDRPRPMAEVCPGLPMALYQLLDDMLAKEPPSRPSMVQVVERIRQLEQAGGLPQSVSAAGSVGPGRARAGTLRTQLVTARREQGGVYLSWPLLVGGLIGTVLLSLLGMMWALGGPQPAAPPPPQAEAAVPALPAPPATPAPAPPATAAQVAPPAAQEEPGTRPERTRRGKRSRR